MIVIAIIGILAAIALPAYARYMARARFTEVTTALDGVKKQVELCIFDQGANAFAANALIVQANCGNGQPAILRAAGGQASGWQIGANVDYATNFVNDITVVNGVITATAINGNGLNGASIQLEPHYGAADNGVIVWERNDANSTCVNMELC